MMWFMMCCLRDVSRGSFIVALGRDWVCQFMFSCRRKGGSNFGIYDTAISALNVNVNGAFPTRCPWSMPRCDVDVVL